MDDLVVIVIAGLAGTRSSARASRATTDCELTVHLIEFFGDDLAITAQIERIPVLTKR